MKNGICPKCNAAAIYRQQDNNGAYGLNRIPLGGSALIGGINYAHVDTYICTHCGYCEKYIRDRTNLTYVVKHWEHIAPQPSSAPAPDSGDTRRLR